MARERFALRNCLFSRDWSRAERLKLVVVDGGLSFTEALPNGVQVYECREPTLITPCSYVAWLLPLNIGENVTHREIPAVLASAAGGESYDVGFACSIVRSLPRYGVCGAVVSVPPGVSLESCRPGSSFRLRYSVLALPDESSVEEAFRYARRLGGDAVVELVNTFQAPDSLLKSLAIMAGEESRILYLHASYAKREVYESKKRWGLFPVERLHRLGVLSPSTVLVGGGWVSSWELNYVAEARTAIVYSPVHDAFHALGGHFPLYEALKLGVKVYLGLGFASPTPDPRTAVLAALLIQRYVYWDTRVNSGLAARLASEAADILGGWRGLEEGAADFAVYSVDPAYSRIAEEKPALAVIGGGSTVAAVVVEGEIIYVSREGLRPVWK